MHSREANAVVAAMCEIATILIHDGPELVGLVQLFVNPHRTARRVPPGDSPVTLLPLQSMLVVHADEICSHLDGKNAVAYRQHVLIDFQRVVVDEFTNFMESNSPPHDHTAEYVIGGVFYALLTRTAVDSSMECLLVLDALRRSDNSLAGATEAELSDYLDGFDAD